jgi:hypothetical protein
MSDLAILGDAPVSRYGAQDNLQKQFAKGKNFLPRIEFKSASATVCKEKKFKIDHYALVRDNQLYDMGENFTAIILSYRYKAIDFREKGKVKVSYEPESTEFKTIVKDADSAPQGQMSGCMYGAEFLLAVKRPDGVIELATLLCGSTSWKNIVEKMFGMTRRFCSFSSKLVQRKFTYTAPEVSTYGGSFSLESIPALNAAIQEFAGACGNVEEEASPPEEGDRVR